MLCLHPCRLSFPCIHSHVFVKEGQKEINIFFSTLLLPYIIKLEFGIWGQKVRPFIRVFPQSNPSLELSRLRYTFLSSVID